jgi:chromosome segregation ATPase
MQDMGQLTTFLKERIFDVYIDKQPSQKSILDAGFFGSGGDTEVYQADRLVQDACAVKITPEMLASYKSEWEDKLRAEKERETELENLRSQNNALTHKVRGLEASAEQRDTEHVKVISDLVRMQMENQTLQDQNESLKGQVEELRVVVQHQTEEVEARMQTEMDKVVLRNKEVHDDNRRMEEEVSDMGKELVEAKMRYAEVKFVSISFSAVGRLTHL